MGGARTVISRGVRELASGGGAVDRYAERGRKTTEERLPNLLTDIRAIVDGQSQTDPSFASTRLYTRLSASAVREALVSQKGYCEADLPSLETIRVRLNRLGYTLRSVQKTLPKKITETDVIFEELTSLHTAARTDETVLRLSLDTKAAIKIGTFARGGKTRAHLQAADHDFAAAETLSLFGIFLPELDEVYFISARRT